MGVVVEVSRAMPFGFHNSRPSTRLGLMVLGISSGCPIWREGLPLSVTEVDCASATKADDKSTMEIARHLYFIGFPGGRGHGGALPMRIADRAEGLNIYAGNGAVRCCTGGSRFKAAARFPKGPTGYRHEVSQKQRNSSQSPVCGLVEWRNHVAHARRDPAATGGAGPQPEGGDRQSATVQAVGGRKTAAAGGAGGAWDLGQRGAVRAGSAGNRWAGER